MEYHDKSHFEVNNSSVKVRFAIQCSSFEHLMRLILPQTCGHPFTDSTNTIPHYMAIKRDWVEQVGTAASEGSQVGWASEQEPPQAMQHWLHEEMREQPYHNMKAVASLTGDVNPPRPAQRQWVPSRVSCTAQSTTKVRCGTADVDSMSCVPTQPWTGCD
jgi:hypothetical protein